MPWSSLFLLRRIQERWSSRLRWLERLLMLVRCAVLALLILAFSGPAWISPQASGPGLHKRDREPVRLLVLVDTSYSMGYQSHGKTRLGVCLSAAEQILKQMRPQDTAAIVPFSDRWPQTPIEWTGDVETLKRRLQSVSLSFRPTDYQVALQNAYNLMSETKNPNPSLSRPRNVILMLSDNAAHGFPGGSGGLGLKNIPSFDPYTLLLGLDWQEKAPNAEVEDVSLEEARPGRLASHIRLFGPDRDDWGAELRQIIPGSAEKVLQRKRIDLKTFRGVPQSVSWEIPQPNSSLSSWFTGEVRIQNDSLPADDHFFIAFHQKPKLRALCLYGDAAFMNSGRTGFFLKKLLAGGGEDSLQMDFLELSRLGKADLSRYPVILLSHFKTLPEDGIKALKQFLDSGGRLWVLPSEGMEPGGLGELQMSLPGRLVALEGFSNSSGVGLVLKQPPPARSDGFHWRDFELSQICFQKYYKISAEKGALTWFSAPSEDPLLIESPDHRILLSAFPFDWNWTNLPLKPIFVPLVRRVLDHLSGAPPSELVSLEPGTQFRKTWEDKKTPPDHVWLTSPDGNKSKISLHGPQLSFSDTIHPGIYRIEYQNERVAQEEFFAVNLPRRFAEGDLTPATRIPWRLLSVNRLPEDFHQALYGTDAGATIAGWAVLLLAAESLLRTRFGKESSAWPPKKEPR